MGRVCLGVTEAEEDRLCDLGLLVGSLHRAAYGANAWPSTAQCRRRNRRRVGHSSSSEWSFSNVFSFPYSCLLVISRVHAGVNKPSH